MPSLVHTTTNRPGTYFVGADDGFAYTKISVIFLAHTSPEEPAPQAEFVGNYSIPSRAALGAHLSTRLGAVDVSSEYHTEGVDYTVLEDAATESESTQFEAYPFSDLNRTIVQHALRVGGLPALLAAHPENQLKLMSGLPLSRYYVNGGRNRAVIDRKVQSLSLAVTALDGTSTVHIPSSKVMPEGLGAWFDFALEPSGGYCANFNPEETTVVVDIGGHTTDVLTVQPNSVVAHRQTGSETVGVLNVLEEFSTELFNAFGIEQKNLAKLEKAVQSGKYKISGVEHDVATLVDKSKRAAASKIMRAVNRFIGTAIDVDRILLVGGGAAIYGAHICAEYPQATVLADSGMANANGFAKALLVAHKNSAGA